MEWKERELKDREEIIKREIEELFYKSIVMSKNDMDKFEEQEMKEIMLFEKNWYESLIKQTLAREKDKND